MIFGPGMNISTLGTRVYRHRSHNVSGCGERADGRSLEQPVAGLRSVLIVDDDPDVVRTFARTLRLSGYDVLTAVDAESALNRLAADHPDAALVDLRLPMAEGVAFMRRLRAQDGNQRTPVAIVTGDYLLDDAVLGELRALNTTVYFKPLWLGELVGLTEFLLRGDE
jgi:two-component system, OmpR family, response regulator PrrA